MNIVLIRHGETSGNAERRLQLPETPLSERGLAQAHQLGARLGRLGIDRILASDYARAHMTAKCVKASTRAPIALDAGLRERNFGDLRGCLYSELGRDPFGPGYVPPNGESWETLDRRVDAGWQRITRPPDHRGEQRRKHHEATLRHRKHGSVASSG